MKITILMSLLLLSIFNSSNGKNLTCKNYYSASTDTLRYVILKFDKERPYAFDKTNQPATLSSTEVNQIETLIIKKVAEYNKSKKKGIYPLMISHPEKYYKQFVAVINSKGEKEVWVNCLCTIENTSYWKTRIVGMLDGGSCYFQLKINLAKNMVYDFGVNGVA